MAPGSFSLASACPILRLGLPAAVTAVPVGNPLLHGRRRPDDDLLSLVASASAHAAVTAAKADGGAEPNASSSPNINPVSAAMTSTDGPNNPASAIAS
jgi:hypothetical protein